MIIKTSIHAQNFIDNGIKNGFIVHNTVTCCYEIGKEKMLLTGYGYRSMVTDDINQFIGFNLELIDKTALAA
jgi:hypothetical protein